MEFFACADKIRRHREESKRATVNIENISRSFRLFSCFRFDDFSHRSTMFRKAHWNAEQFRECAEGVHAWHRIEELVLRSAFGIPNKQAIECTRHLRHHIRKPLRKWVKLSGNNSNEKTRKCFETNAWQKRIRSMQPSNIKIRTLENPTKIPWESFHSHLQLLMLHGTVDIFTGCFLMSLYSTSLNIHFIEIPFGFTQSIYELFWYSATSTKKCSSL